MRHGSQSKQHTSCYGGKKEPAMRHHETVSGELVYSTRRCDGGWALHNCIYWCKKEPARSIIRLSVDSWSARLGDVMEVALSITAFVDVLTALGFVLAAGYWEPPSGLACVKIVGQTKTISLLDLLQILAQRSANKHPSFGVSLKWSTFLSASSHMTD